MENYKIMVSKKSVGKFWIPRVPMGYQYPLIPAKMAQTSNLGTKKGEQSQLEKGERETWLFSPFFLNPFVIE